MNGAMERVRIKQENVVSVGNRMDHLPNKCAERCRYVNLPVMVGAVRGNW
jgi:hypothetical protein